MVTLTDVMLVCSLESIVFFSAFFFANKCLREQVNHAL